MFETKVVEKIKTHFMFGIYIYIYIYIYICLYIFCPKCAVYEIMWKDVVEPGRPRMTIWRIACWIPKATNTHSKYVIFIDFPL